MPVFFAFWTSLADLNAILGFDFRCGTQRSSACVMAST
jgi:hypothetical protein